MEWHELPKYNGIQVSQLIYQFISPVHDGLYLKYFTYMSCYSIRKMQDGFDFKGRMWVLIVQVPGHTCHFFLSFFM